MTGLLSRLNEITGWGEPLILGWFLVFIRVGGMMAVLPAFGEQTIPARVRLGVTLAFSMVVAPLVMMPLQTLPANALLAEAVIGLMLGLGLRFLIFALQTAGMLIAQAVSLAQLFGAVGEPQPVISGILTVTALALAVAMGLHLKVVELLLKSYMLFPQGQFPSGTDVAEWGVAQTTRCLGMAVSLAAPFVAASLLYNVALGIINRAMPQLMVSFIGAPAMTLGGMALFALASPFLLDLWQTALLAFLADPLRIVP